MWFHICNAEINTQICTRTLYFVVRYTGQKRSDSDADAAPGGVRGRHAEWAPLTLHKGARHATRAHYLCTSPEPLPEEVPAKRYGTWVERD